MKMKKIALFVAGFALVSNVFAQETTESHESNLKELPSVELKTMDGKSVNTSDLGFDGPIVISFWATWCSPCKRELNTIHELYTDWQEETGVNLVAVSIDDTKTMNSVAVYVDGKGWEYLVLMDPNGDFKRAMGVNNVPHTFLVDTDGKIVYSHNNYADHDEDLLYEEILKLTKEPAQRSVFDYLQGKWQSIDDKSSYIIFENNLKKDIYNEKVVDSVTFVLTDKCQYEVSDYGFGSGKDKYISSENCYYISELNDQYLTLIYMDRGNSLKYKKVKE